MGFLSFLRTHPPLTVFLCGLLALSFMALVFSFRVANDEDIRNPDMLDYDGLFSRIAGLAYCIEATEEEESKAGIDVRRRRSLPRATTKATDDDVARNETMTTIYVSVPFSAEFVSNLRESASSSSVLAHGSIQLDHLKRASFAKYKGMQMDMTVAVPPSSDEPSLMEDNAVGDDRTTHDLCVRLDAPASFVSDLRESREAPANCSFESVSHYGARLEFISHSKERLPHEWCDGDNDTSMSLTYEVSTGVWAAYVSAEDRELMRVHLLATSVFVLAIAVVVVAAAALRSRRGGRRGIAKGDGRGEMELLPHLSDLSSSGDEAM